MQSKYHETQKDNILFVQTLKTANDSVRKTALKNNLIKTYNDVITNDAPLKIQNVLTSYVRRENKIINPNIEVILQLEKFKTIALTKKQYERVKRIIKRTSSKKSNEIEKRKRYQIYDDIHCNVVSIGTIKMKRKLRQGMRCNRETQTENTSKCVEIQYNSQCHNKLVHKEKAGEIHKNVFSVQEKTIKEKIDPRQILSSMEIRCSNIEHMKLVSLSSQLLGNGSYPYQYSNMQNDIKSLYTIFKGIKQSSFFLCYYY